MLALCGVLYLTAAIDQLRNGNHGLAITFLAYAVANAGLIMATRGR